MDGDPELREELSEYVRQLEDSDAPLETVQHVAVQCAPLKPSLAVLRSVPIVKALATASKRLRASGGPEERGLAREIRKILSDWRAAASDGDAQGESVLQLPSVSVSVRVRVTHSVSALLLTVELQAERGRRRAP
jgi:hypothetical protein